MSDEGFAAAAARALTAMVVVKAAVKETGARQGEMPCQTCGGTIRWSIAPNGHTRGACITTKGCLSWIE